MSESINNDIVYLTIIAERKHKSVLQDALIEKGGKLIHSAHGRGSVKSGFLQDILGLIHEEQKIIFTCLIKRCDADGVLGLLKERFSADKVNTGIAFIVPLQKLSF